MAHDVFVSHSSNDAQVALAIVAALESHGVRCWIAPRDIQVGQIWAEAIMAAIHEARAMVIVFSSNANRSSHVLTEVDIAVRRGCIVVPFRIEAVDPEGALAYHLRTRHWLDALTPEMELHIGRLVDTLSRLLAAAPESAPGASEPWLKSTPPPPPTPDSPDLSRTAPTRWKKPAILGAAALFLVVTMLIRGALAPAEFVIRDGSAGDTPVELPVRVTGIRFFEGPGQMPRTTERTHATRFASGASRFLYVQVDLDHASPPREIRLPLSCTISDRTGAVITTIAAVGRIQSDWTGSNWASGWGTEAGGSWKVGRYTADCSYGGRSIARGRFEVVGGGASPEPVVDPENRDRVEPRIAVLNGRVVALRFFASSGGRLTPKEQRRYTTTFTAQELEYLGVEVELQYPAPGRTISLEIRCEITTGEDRRFGEVTLPITPQPSWTGSFSAGSYGWPQPGRWTAGRYRVACRLADQLVASGQVTLR